MVEGNRYCQAIDLLAFGYFRARAPGRCTVPNPLRISSIWMAFTVSICLARAGLIVAGRIARRSFAPLPS